MNKTKGHVLLVDDDDGVRRLVADYLREEGYLITEALLGDEAISLIELGKTFDMVFTDVRMPGTEDGFGVAQRIRQIHPEIPILVATGYPNHIAKQISLLGPPTSYVVKPFRMSEVSAVVSSLIGNRSRVNQ